MVQSLRRIVAYKPGVYYATLTGNLSITTEMPQHFSLDGGASSRNLTFYAPDEHYTGTPYFFYNRGSTDNLVVKDASSNTLATLLPSQAAEIMYSGSTNGWVVISKSGAGAGGSDFGAPGLQADVVAESTSAAGVTVDGLLIKDGDVRVGDSDAVTYGADQDILYTHDGTASVRVTNAASGTVGYDDDVLNICDPADATKRVRIDAGLVTAGQTRVISIPDGNVTMVTDPASLATLALTTTGNGAALIGVEDAAASLKGTTVEAALAELSTPVGLSAAAEAGDNIVVTVAGVAQVAQYIARLYDSAALLALSAAFTIAETGAGAEVSTTAKSSLIFTTDANGAASLTLHDVAGASGASLFLEVSPFSVQAGAKASPTGVLAITFDGS